MFKLLEGLIASLAADGNAAEPMAENQLHLATAALLVEVASIDRQFDPQEWASLHRLLKQECQLNDDDAKSLIEEAQQASGKATSLYEFTQHINQLCDYDQKLSLVKGLWKIAYADGNLDKYEEHIIRRIADLIHVSHRDFIQEKIKVRDENQHNES
ncbi:MAG: TerB family tellurite resistance protein [Pseudomonadota bacterium]